ncbi:hypothetical protein A5707_16385 [Mycobacterium kyorinense]|uniref:HNH nuclease domain-containing protein n=1 Tax=Mycobacterium kyorinense TaxID=487514 RepID=A0A1A2ZL31_9MYCO|nr:hypothetical protein A5707_16385 [Mycobacterium kyorinense]
MLLVTQPEANPNPAVVTAQPLDDDPEDAEGDLAPIDPVDVPESPKPSAPASENVLSILTEITSGSIDISPKWQRRDIWSEKKKAALIESIFFNLPLPLFYLADAARTIDGEEIPYREVVDGQQRLRAIRDFYNGDLLMPKDSAVAGLENKKFKELSPKRQAFFTQFKLSTATIPLKTEVGKHELFRRLNQNPTTLTAQELRNADNTGPYLDLLIESAKGLNDLLRITEANYKRMKDVEFLTRLVAFARSGPAQFPNKKLDKFLNEEMKTGASKSPEERVQLIARVTKALERVNSVFGEFRFRPFRIVDGKSNDGEWASTLNRPLMEVQAYSFLDHSTYGFSDAASFDKALHENRLDLIENARRLHTLNDRFNDTLQRGTTGKPNVEYRFERYRAMVRYTFEEVPDGKKRRFFTRQQKHNIWDKLAPVDRKCPECFGDLSFENSDVDHIQPWAEGGETVEENGQLLHPACNRTKGTRWDPKES